ncbi:MAG: class I SAM-dependent methyltransferase [Treponemataceae bacterium]|nr:class I SAM-dependent methyltransferase [Treponemataceae bacterium]
MERLIEYYDELYPSTEKVCTFFKDLVSETSASPKYLRIGCGTGLLETKLSKLGLDVTGIETSRPLLNSASLRYRLPTMSIRFFQMSSTEMVNFLGSNFYDLISCINDRLIFLQDDASIQKFFIDCKTLLTEGGKLVLQLFNYDLEKGQNNFSLPLRQSIRSKLFSEIERNGKEAYITQTLENSSGRLFDIIKSQKVSIVSLDTIERFAKKAGFTSVTTYSDYEMKPFTKDSESLICVIQ